MLDFDTAQAQLVNAAPRPHTHETCALRHCAGRVLAAPFIATLDLPPHDNSAMDGYALRHADVYYPDTRLPVQQRCYAGEVPAPLQAGKATRLFTGSLIPANADTVVMQEDCSETDGMLTIQSLPTPGAHIRRRASDMAQGSTLLPAGSLLGAAHIAVLAAQGAAHVPVYPRLKVGVLTTGDELIAPGKPLQTAQLYDTNGVMLAAMLNDMGAVVPHVLHAADTQNALTSALTRLQQDCNLILSVGGISVGEKDLVKPAITALGGQLDWWRVNMKPGKPVALARLGNTPLVCLPGNPVSAFVVFLLLVSPMVRAMQGRATVLPATETGTSAQDMANHNTRTEFVRVQAIPDGAQSKLLTHYPQQESNIISSLPWASGIARIPAQTVIPAGGSLIYYPFASWFR